MLSYVGSRDLGLVALIQDYNAWGSPSWETELQANDISYEVLPISSLVGLNYGAYDMIITASDGQVDSRIYDAYSDIQSYVDGGGIAAISLCGQGHTGDFGGLVTTQDYPTWNSVADIDHPLMAGVANPFPGGSASHTSFTSVPDGYSILATSDNTGNFITGMTEGVKGFMGGFGKLYQKERI